MERVLLGQQSAVASLLPSWIFAELKYGLEKYGTNNPQKFALTEGLHPGSRAFQDHFNYLGKFAFFYDDRNEFEIGLKAAQAVCKMALIATALVVSFPQRTHQIESPVETFLQYEQTSLGLLLPTLRAPEIVLNPIDHATILEKHLSAVDVFLKNNEFSAAEEAARQLIVTQCEYAIGHVSRIGFMSAPGLPSGDTALWPFNDYYS